MVAECKMPSIYIFDIIRYNSARDMREVEDAYV